jgi:AraC-like DNA-binding protein
MAAAVGGPRGAAPDEPERWRASLGAAFCDLVPGQLGDEGPPRGALRGGCLGAASVFTVSGSPQTVRRTTTAVRQSPADMLKVCVQLRGRATVHQDDREIVLLPGQLALYDIGRPYELRLEGIWTCAVMAVQRDRVALSPAGLTGAMERAHLAGRGPGLLLSQFITSTVNELDAVAPAASGMLDEAGACLLAGTLTSDGDRAAASGHDAVRNQVLGYIRTHLEDPRLTRATVAAAHHMSPRTLDRLFSGQPWSAGGYIRHERLAAVRRDLENPALRHRSVSALAARWCFFDAAHFSRLFREEYGYPPSQARP